MKHSFECLIKLLKPLIAKITSTISFICKDQHTNIKGEVSYEFDVISNPQNVFVNTNKKIIVLSFAINYHPRAIKLLISAPGQIKSRSEWIET